jgi:predicted nucleic acid-binding protein
MMFLLDTNAFSDLMRKHSKLDARMSSLAPADTVVICTLSRVKFGMVLNSFREASAGKIWKAKRGLYSLLFRASQFLKRRAIIMRRLS